MPPPGRLSVRPVPTLKGKMFSGGCLAGGLRLTGLMSGTSATQFLSEDYGRAYSANYDRTLRFLASLGASQDAAEEIAQAAWAKGWEYRHQLRKVASLLAWINSIAKNMLRRHIRGERYLQALPESLPSPWNPAAVELRWLLDRLRRFDRDLLKWHYLEGYTAVEIAQATGLSPAAIRVRLLRIRRSRGL